LGLIIEGLDQKAECQELCSEELKYRNKLERELEEILIFEEKIGSRGVRPDGCYKGTLIQFFPWNSQW
jgi:hypothetical protein